MKKVYLSIYCITVMVICQVLQGSCGVMAIGDGQKSAIINRCDTQRDDLKKVQRNDSRTRVYLGGYYEGVLNKFITPLNVKLVEGSLSNADFVENQNRFASAKVAFANDFVNYQKGLEELIAIDCKTEPERFYDRLTSVRKKRKVVEQDVGKLKNIMGENVKLVKGLMEKIQDE